MPRFALRLGLLFVALAAFAPPASAQISWNVTYTDGNIRPGGVGFADNTVVGSTTVGQLRRDCVNTATGYLNTVLDGRGTVNIEWGPSFNSAGDSTLAFFGPQKFATFSLGQGNIVGSFQNGGVYQSARTNTTAFGGPDGSGQVNFGHNYHYDVAGTNTTLSGNVDLVSVLTHELGHGLGIVNFADPSTPSNTKGQYTEFERSMQRGNTVGSGALFATNINQSNYGSFLGPASTFTGGNTQNNAQTTFTNNTTSGLYFGGKYAQEVFNGPIPLYSPTTYSPGSSISHVNVGPNDIGLMNYQIGDGVTRRFQNYEIAILLDIGWNSYDWNTTTGDWSDGVKVGQDVFDSRWETSKGLYALDGATPPFVYNARSPDGSTIYGKAPVLPVYGQVTSNIVMNFGGSGASSYVSTNDLGSIRLARLNLDSSTTSTNTITGGTLQFGVNSDGTASVLTPKIVQSNSGAFTINSNIVMTNTTPALGGGWTGLTVDGPGSGKVALGGIISGGGTLTKSGNFTLELNGSSANTFTGTTTVNGGVLLLNKTPTASAIVGDLNIGSGGIVRLAAADQIQGDGTGGKKITLSGGTLSTGATTGFGDSVGAFELTASSTIALGSGAHSLKFTGITGTPTGTLTITGWSGDQSAPGTAGKILFSDIGTTPNTTFATFLGSVQFDTFGAGGTFLDTGTPGLFELAPVPEPSTILAIAFGALGLGALARRRSLRRSLVSWDL